MNAITLLAAAVLQGNPGIFLVAVFLGLMFFTRMNPKDVS